MEVKDPVKTETAPETKVETHVVETKTEVPVVEEKKEVVSPEPPKEEPKAPIPPPEPKTPPYRKEMDTKRSFEERILAYMDSRTGNVKLNDFLKSLYPLPKGNVPPVWTDQGNMKRLRVLLDTMQCQGKIEIVANAHVLLGRAYYPDTTTMKTEYHNLGTVVVECAKK